MRFITFKLKDEFAKSRIYYEYMFVIKGKGEKFYIYATLKNIERTILEMEEIITCVYNFKDDSRKERRKRVSDKYSRLELCEEILLKDIIIEQIKRLIAAEVKILDNKECSVYRDRAKILEIIGED